jgi:hypothetical protein
MNTAHVCCSASGHPASKNRRENRQIETWKNLASDRVIRLWIIRLREGFAEVRFLVDKDESEHEQIGFKPGTLFTSAKPSLARMMTAEFAAQIRTETVDRAESGRQPASFDHLVGD